MSLFVGQTEVRINCNDSYGSLIKPQKIIEIENWVNSKLESNGILGNDTEALWISEHDYYENYDFYRLMDEDFQYNIFYLDRLETNKNIPIIFYTPKQVQLNEFIITGNSLDDNNLIFEIYGSNEPFVADYEQDSSINYFASDSSLWTEISFNKITANEYIEFTFNNENFYHYYKIVIRLNASVETTFSEFIMAGNSIKIPPTPMEIYLSNHEVKEIKSTSDTATSSTEVVVFNTSTGGRGNFSGTCSNLANLETLIIKKVGGSGWNHYQNAFNNDTKLKNVIFNGSMTMSGSGHLTGIFNGSNNIEKIYINKNYTPPANVMNQISSKNCIVYTDYTSESDNYINTYFSVNKIVYNYSINDFFTLLNNE